MHSFTSMWKLKSLTSARGIQPGDLISPASETFESAPQSRFTQGSQIQATAVTVEVHDWWPISPTVCIVTGVTDKVRW